MDGEIIVLSDSDDGEPPEKRKKIEHISRRNFMHNSDNSIKFTDVPGVKPTPAKKVVSAEEVDNKSYFHLLQQKPNEGDKFELVVVGESHILRLVPGGAAKQPVKQVPGVVPLPNAVEKKLKISSNALPQPCTSVSKPQMVVVQPAQPPKGNTATSLQHNINVVNNLVFGNSGKIALACQFPSTQQSEIPVKRLIVDNKGNLIPVLLLSKNNAASDFSKMPLLITLQQKNLSSSPNVQNLPQVVLPAKPKTSIMSTKKVAANKPKTVHGIKWVYEANKPGKRDLDGLTHRDKLGFFKSEIYKISNLATKLDWFIYVRETVLASLENQTKLLLQKNDSNKPISLKNVCNIQQTVPELDNDFDQVDRLNLLQAVNYRRRLSKGKKNVRKSMKFRRKQLWNRQIKPTSQSRQNFVDPYAKFNLIPCSVALNHDEVHEYFRKHHAKGQLEPAVMEISHLQSAKRQLEPAVMEISHLQIQLGFQPIEMQELWSYKNNYMKIFIDEQDFSVLTDFCLKNVLSMRIPMQNIPQIVFFVSNNLITTSMLMQKFLYFKVAVQCGKVRIIQQALLRKFWESMGSNKTILFTRPPVPTRVVCIDYEHNLREESRVQTFCNFFKNMQSQNTTYTVGKKFVSEHCYSAGR